MASQKRLLTAPTSKLTKTDLPTLLRNDSAWTLLPHDLRAHLYTLLPPPQPGEAPHDPDVHPLTTGLKAYIEEELRRFRDDLEEGREVKKWREEAAQAGRERVEGKFDGWKEAQREEVWGRGEENVDVGGGVDGEGGERKDEGGDGEVNGGMDEVKDVEMED